MWLRTLNGVEAVTQSSYPNVNLEDWVKQEIFERFQNAVRESIEIGITPNWLLISPALNAYLHHDIIEFSGMKIWRSPYPLPENREVIAIRLSPTTARKKE